MVGRVERDEQCQREGDCGGAPQDAGELVEAGLHALGRRLDGLGGGDVRDVAAACPDRACDMGDGGGVGPQGRVGREQVRRQAARMFADGMSGAQVAAALEISTKSAYAWRRAW